MYIKITWPKLLMLNFISSSKNVLWLIFQPIQCKNPDNLLGTDKCIIVTQTAYTYDSNDQNCCELFTLSILPSNHIHMFLIWRFYIIDFLNYIYTAML